MNPFENLGKSGVHHEPERKFSLNEYFKEGYILIVDDNSSLRKTIKSMARQFEVNNVVEVEDGDTALKVLRTNDKHCLFVLLDWMMPRMSGLDVVREIRADNEIGDLPILMVTAEADPAQIVRASEEGINGYITKPFVGKSIETKIYSILEARMNPPEHVKLLLAAEAHAKKGDYENALNLYVKSMTIKETARAMVHIGDVHWIRKEAEKAIGMYSNAMANNPRFLKAYSRAADLHESRGNLDAALDLLKRAAEISPNSPERHISIGKLHLKKGEETEAVEAFNRAVRIESKKGADVAEQLLLFEKPKIAETFFRKSLVASGGNDANLHNKIGIALRQQGRWRDAIAEYEAAIKLDPGDETIYFNMGKAYLEGRDEASAAKCFNMALKLKPDSTEIKKMLAELGNGRYKKLGDDF